MTHEDLGQLLSLISHEVRGPLGVMRGYLKLLEQQRPPLLDSQRHAVAAALRAGERATDVLGQVSALGRLHRGEAAATLTPTRLEPLLRAAADAVVMPSEPVITLRLDIPEVTLPADEELLRVALTGLLSAVVRAQVRDTEVVAVARCESADGRPGIALRIGTGEVFAPSLKRAPLDVRRGGLGLDLPVAAFVIGAHHGSVAEIRQDHRFAGVEVWLPR